MNDLFEKYPEMQALKKAVEARQREIKVPSDYQRLFSKPAFLPAAGSAASCETLAAHPPAESVSAETVAAHQAKPAPVSVETAQPGSIVRNGDVGPLSIPDQAKIIPMIGLAAAQRNAGGAWRLWTLAKACDPAGAGALQANALASCAGSAGIHPRSYARWLHDAVKLGWIRQTKDRKVLYLAGPAVVASALQLAYVPSVWVMVDLRGLLKEKWQGVVWAAVLTLHPGNISREKLRQVTGVPERTQLHYESLTGISCQRSYAVSNLPGQDKNFVAGYRETKRKGAFSWFDRRTGKHTIAWRVPDKRQVPGFVAYAISSRGRLSKINRRLALLASSSFMGSSGTSSMDLPPSGSTVAHDARGDSNVGRALGESTGRLFYDKHQAAEKGARRIRRRMAKENPRQAEVQEVYHPRRKGRNCQTYGVVFL